jgi:hypothetical protein
MTNNADKTARCYAICSSVRSYLANLRLPYLIRMPSSSSLSPIMIKHAIHYVFLPVQPVV